MNWPNVPFEEIYMIPSRNGVYKSKEFHGRGCRIVNMGELFGFDFISNQGMNRVALKESELSNNLLVDGDLLFGRRSLIESGAGKCSLVISPGDDLTFESSIIRVRLNKEIVNPRYFFYYFKSPQGRCRVGSIVSGTNVKGIRGSDLKKLSIPIPPKEYQDTTVDILSAYDDLIENNNRQIQLLEQAARQLYNEWFVRLRFPGHEQAKVVDGVPKGWARKTAYDAMAVLSGGTPKTDVADYWGGEIPFFTPKDAINRPYASKTEKSITNLGISKCNSRLYPKDTLFITARGTVGNLNLANGPMAMNQSCYALVAREPLNQFFLYLSLQSAIQQFKSRAVGAVFNSIVVDTFKSIPFVIPTKSLVSQFSELVEPIFQQTLILANQNEKLREARDLLLPRLMNGEIRV